MSTLFITTIGHNPNFNALEVTNLVCGIVPSAASTSKTTPSTIFNIRSTSPPKSEWPGVSIIFNLTSFQTTEVDLANIVMPLSFSKSLLSITLSTNFSLSLKAPDCLKS